MNVGVYLNIYIYTYKWNNISYMDPMGLENDQYFSLLREPAYFQERF